MDNLRIQGGARLEGRVGISGAKNAALPILCAALLADGDHCFRNVPGLRDVRTMGKLLETLGLGVRIEGHVVEVASSPVPEPLAPYELVKQMRASVLVLGPLVARYGRARVSLPGGCAIGSRPVDLFIEVLEALGAETLVHLWMGEDRLIMRADKRPQVSEGQELGLMCAAEAMTFFDENGWAIVTSDEIRDAS